ncbi:hypothetical protein KGF57_001751 [Candida theae]|uniref:Uncharacterized protein n=1 Tax=Candida theae TaxID=1198502 RepID=A0AAD5BGB5_9ASCO|nr:uncharacterized protein KGF57_001751 [Candida theae]KAI5961328.1 hypothetical protein KGF57_001751 [Candida theae]
MKFTTIAAAFAGLATTLVQAAPVVAASEELQTIQSDLKHLNSDVNNLINSLNLNLNEKAQKDLANGHESDELIAELGRSLLDASKGNADVLSFLHQVAKRDAVEDEIVGAVDVSKRGGFVTIEQHQISIDAIIKAIEYVIVFNHPLPNPDHFNHVLAILGIDVEVAAQINITYDTVSIDFAAILTKLIDIGHEVVDIAEKVITVTLHDVTVKIEAIFKAIEYIIIQHHHLPNHDNFAGLLVILGIDIETAHSIGIWEWSSSFDVVAVFTKFLGFGVFSDVAV